MIWRVRLTPGGAAAVERFRGFHSCAFTLTKV